MAHLQRAARADPRPCSATACVCASSSSPTSASRRSCRPHPAHGRRRAYVSGAVAVEPRRPAACSRSTYRRPTPAGGRLRAFADRRRPAARSRSVRRDQAAAPAAGDRGRTVGFLQHRLRDLRYVVSGSGYLRRRTARAVIAYRKVTGMDRLYAANRQMFERLARKRGRFQAKYPRHGKHVEADLSRQVLALVRPPGQALPRAYRRHRASPEHRRRSAGPSASTPRRPDELEGHGQLELLHRRVRHPRLSRRARLRGQPRMPARSPSRTRRSCSAGWATATASTSTS